MVDESMYIASVTIGLSKPQEYKTTNRQMAFDWLEQMEELANKHNLKIIRIGIERKPLSQIPQGDMPWGDDVTRDWHG